jgi:tetrahydromethanopterin S-methyltransferase subunit G
MYRVEESTAVQEEQIKEANHRLEDLERKVG